jgi:hypothetical protein
LTYVKRRKLAAQRLICCCPYHVGFRFALAGLNRYVSAAHAGVGGCDDRELWTTDTFVQKVTCIPVDDIEDDPALLKCCEGRCTHCSARLNNLTLCCHATSHDAPVVWKAFAKEDYVTKKGKKASRTQLVTKSASLADFLVQVTSLPAPRTCPASSISNMFVPLRPPYPPSVSENGEALRPA